MPSKKKYDVVATVGKYTNASGEEKSRFMKCGVVLEGDDGRMSMKLEAIPVTPEWSGWLSFFEPRDERDQGHATARPANAAAEAAGVGDDDEIPF